MERLKDWLVYHVWMLADRAWIRRRDTDGYFLTTLGVQRWVSNWFFERPWAHDRCNRYIRRHHIEVE